MSDPTVRAAATSLLELLLRQGIQLVTYITLGRLLAPSEFGVAALALAIVLVVSSVADLGLSTAVVRHLSPSRRLLSTAFWTSAALGALFALVLALTSPLVARLFGVPELRDVLPVMAVVVCVSALGSVHIATLTRALAFHTLSAVTASAVTVSGVLAVVLALRGWGYWSLVAHAVATSLLTVVGLSLRTPFRPSLHWDAAELRSLLGFGSFVAATATLDAIATRAPLIALGTLVGPAPLGQYSRGDQTQSSLTDLTSSVVGRVALPVFARSSANADALREGARSGLRYGIAVNAPIMLVLAGVGRPLMTGLFGPAWAEGGSIFSVLCIAAALWPVHVVSVNALLALGLARRVFVLDLQKKAVLAVALWAGLRYGALGVAWATVAYGVSAAALNAAALAREVQYPSRTQLADVFRVLIAAAAGGTVAAIVSRHLDGPDLGIAAAGSVAGFAMYVSVALALRDNAIRDLVVRLRQSR